jgi:hypothetical protein
MSLYVLVYKTSEETGVHSYVYPSLDLGRKALEVKRFESCLDWSLYQLVPVQESNARD